MIFFRLIKGQIRTFNPFKPCPRLSLQGKLYVKIGISFLSCFFPKLQATDDEIKGRKICKAKRRNLTQDQRENVFSGFSFSSASTNKTGEYSYNSSLIFSNMYLGTEFVIVLDVESLHRSFYLFILLILLNTLANWAQI